MKPISANVRFLAALIAVSCLLVSCQESINNQLNLEGEWRFQTDPEDVGVDQAWYESVLEDQIVLPGSMAENDKGEDPSVSTHWTGNMWNDSLWYTSEKYAKYRAPDNTKISFWLTPRKVYYGPAWYQRTVEIPENWTDKYITLHLERPHWETTVWINDRLIGRDNYLGTPHTYLLPEGVEAGTHTLTIRVDNRVSDIEVGLDAHSISDNTQSNWNGIIGDIYISAQPKVHLEDIRLFPSVREGKVDVVVAVNNKTRQQVEAKIKLSARLKEGESVPLPALEETVSLAGIDTLNFSYDMGEDFATWDEFEPNVYELTVTLESELGKDDKVEDFGMRDFDAVGQHFEVNGRPIFLRGTLECAIFPLTGYPPAEVQYWKKIYQALKDHGLNHMRFHSWCPPEAAFVAADEMGIYLQVEASVWTYLGDGKPIDAWLFREAENIMRQYGNHPSFVMFAHGNEPRGDSLNTFLNRFLAHFQELDPTKVYAPASGWPYLEQADYYVPYQPRIHRWNEGLNSIINREAPQTEFDYDDFSSAVDQPIVSHEIGQWCVYPDFSGLDKYTGVLEPRNFEIFQETLEENDMGDLADSFLLASGKLQTICYKADIEAAMRTKPFAGFQLLDLHDFPGQGTALVGVLDAFWEEKGYVSPAAFRSFCGPTTLLVRWPKRVYYSGDSLVVPAEVAHFGSEPLQEVSPSWQITSEDVQIIGSGKLADTDLPLGNQLSLGDIAFDLPQIDQAERMILELTVAESKNSWDFWIFPKVLPDLPENDILITDEFDSKLKQYLEAGGRAILQLGRGDLRPEAGGDIEIGFSSIFWNTSWTSGQAPHTLGLLCNPEHPALAEFPTEYHSDWQWWEPISTGAAIVIDDLDPGIEPIVRVIDDWFENRKTALIFEAKVGAGKLLVAGVDLESDLENRPVVKQLRYSLLKYMGSDRFDPKTALTPSSLSTLMK
ncbi:MAG: sugar-binding domain-containing protein [Bacteroidota bacterium]